jgi:hypothetical protein
VSACFFVHEMHGRAETCALVEEKNESPWPGRAIAKAATAAADAAVAPTATPRTSRRGSARERCSKAHVDGTGSDSWSKPANAATSRVHERHSAQTRR